MNGVVADRMTDNFENNLENLGIRDFQNISQTNQRTCVCVSFLHDCFIFGWCSLVRNRILKVSNIMFSTRLKQ